jgi:hypothetical protein
MCKNVLSFHHRLIVNYCYNVSNYAFCVPLYMDSLLSYHRKKCTNQSHVTFYSLKRFFSKSHFNIF